MPRQRHVSAPPPKAPSASWRPFVIALASVLVYLNSLSAPFIFDDEFSVVSNAAIRAPGQVLSQGRDAPLAGRPVVGLTFALNFAASELDARAYRATNIAIHLGSALLLFGLLRRTLMMPRLRDRYGAHALDLATAVAVVWAVHPLNTEAANYVTQRTELLYGFFYLLVLYAVARSHGSNRPRLWQGLAIVSCALGMASKESMVTAPVAVLLYERVFALAMQGQFKEALVNLEAAVKLRPEDPALHDDLARVQKFLHR